ncbi:MAG: dihydrodipicolinate synthase family protein [Tardiphaga sp.]|nr:dihydrodipicolinate synthase family protein [Tardiphaga sp.]
MNKPVQPKENLQTSSLSLKLPKADRSIETYWLAASRTFPSRLEGTLNRVAFSAAHVVADPLAECDPWLTSKIDWDRTIAFREHVWDLGLGVAEAMDTAQRGMGMDWPTSLELIQRSVAAAKPRGGLVFSGAGTDHLAVEDAKSIDDVIKAYEEQFEAIEKVGGRIILMASRALAKLGKNAEDYGRVYDRILSQSAQPVIIHWLGDMFDPGLANYWGTPSLDTAMDIAVDVINRNAAKVDGVKVSLLDAQREIDMRRRLKPDVKMYTGDDFNYAELIAGDDKGFSHALLGIFDAIAPAASYALSRLAAGDDKGFHDVLAPTVPLSRHIFKAPTRFYKTGIVFMAYLNGHQDHFTMVGGQESTRSTLHLAELFRLADQAGLLVSPELATQRMKAILAVRGIEA